MEIKITVNGQELPCRPTMGAMLRFKKETGKEVTEIKSENISDFLIYLYFCIVSACKRDGIRFDMSLMDFADAITQDDIVGWAKHLQEEVGETPEGEEKKSL